MKVLIILSLVLLISTNADAQKSQKPIVSKSAVGAKTDSPDASMRLFIRALMKQDRTVFLSFLSQKTPLRWRNYQAVGVSPTFVKYATIATDFKKKGDYYYTFLARGENGDLDCFADSATAAKGKIWKKIGKDKFIPPDSEYSPNGDYVKWKKEAGKWIISEISYNTA